MLKIGDRITHNDTPNNTATIIHVSQYTIDVVWDKPIIDDAGEPTHEEYDIPIEEFETYPL